RVRPLDLVGERLADVVKQRRATRLLLVEADLGGHRPADEGRLKRMLEHVLSIAVAVLQHTEELDELGVNAVNADLEDRLLPRLTDVAVELLLGLANDVLDPARMNAPVGDQPREREARD